MNLRVNRHHVDIAIELFPSFLASFLNLTDKDKVIITIKEDLLTRSQRQNKLYWKWMSIIYTETEQPVQDYYEGGKLHKGMHTKFKDDFIVKEYYADGELKRKSTKELKVAEMHEFLERVNQWSIEWGIRLPQPEQKGVRVDS